MSRLLVVSRAIFPAYFSIVLTFDVAEAMFAAVHPSIIGCS